MGPGLRTLTRILRSLRSLSQVRAKERTGGLAGRVYAEGLEALDAGNGAVHEDGAAVVEEGQGPSGQ